MATKREFLSCCSGAALCVLPWAGVASAQPHSASVKRVAVLTPGTRVWEVFVQTLRELGYAEGINLVLDVRHGTYDMQQLRSLAQELVAGKPDVIVAESTPAALAAKAATKSIPIILVNVSDPEGAGLVDSLARPGGNVTGMSDYGVEIATKQVELVREIVPNAKRLGVVLADNPVHALQLRGIEAAAVQAGLSVVAGRVPREADLEAAFARLGAQKVEALIVLAGTHDGSTERNARLTTLVAKAKLPAIYGLPYMLAVGGLMSYGPDIPESRKIAATYVVSILKGARAADMPVQRPTKFRLEINASAARTLSLALPPSLLIRADDIRE